MSETMTLEELRVRVVHSWPDDAATPDVVACLDAAIRERDELRHRHEIDTEAGVHERHFRDALKSRAECAESELAALRKFAQRIMQSWPYGDVDGGELQDAAIACGLLERSEPTPEEREEEGLEEGDDWYRGTRLLLGPRGG